MLDLIRHRAQSWGVKIIFGIIILVFVFWGVGSVNQSSPNVAALVNDKPISVADFYGTVKSQEQRYLAAGISQEQLKTLQLPQQVLQSLVSRAALLQEAARLGIGVSEKELQNFIMTFPAFMKDGRFDKDTYERIMSSQGKSVVDSEKDLAADMVQDKLREYISLAVVASPDEVRRMHAFQVERRTVSYVLFATEEYLDQVTPTEEQLQSFYNGNAQRFSFPDRTALKYIEVTPDALADGVEVSEEEINTAFAAGPSRYHLSQVLFILPEDADEAAKTAAREKLNALQADIRSGKDLAAAIADASADEPAIVGGDAGWVSVTQLDEKTAPAVTGLVPGGLTEILEAPVGLAFFRLEKTDPDFSGHETVVKAAIRESLAREHALLGFRETQEKVTEAMDLGKSLEEIAADLGVSIRELPVTSRALIPSTLGLKAGTSATLFAGAPDSLVGNILETQDGFIIAKITDQLPSGPIPFEDVRAEIENDVKRIEASRLAEKDANEHLPKFTGADTPEGFQDKVLTSAAFGRDGQTPDFGNAPALATAVFENAPGAWIPRTFAVDKGAVIVMTGDVQALTDDEWKEREAQVTKAVLEGKQNALFSVYMEALNATTKVTVPDTRIFDMF